MAKPKEAISGIPQLIEEFGKGYKIGKEIGGDLGGLTQQASTIDFVNKLRKFEATQREEQERIGATQNLTQALNVLERAQSGGLRTGAPGEGTRPINVPQLATDLQTKAALKFPTQTKMIESVLKPKRKFNFSKLQEDLATFQNVLDWTDKEKVTEAFRDAMSEYGHNPQARAVITKFFFPERAGTGITLNIPEGSQF